MQRLSSSLLILSFAATGYVPMAEALSSSPTVTPRLSGPVLIALKRTVSSDVAERGYTVQLSRGVGLVLNLSGLGDGVSKVWLSDPSKVVFSSQGSVIYLKPIQPLTFPGNYHAADGSTLLTVVTQSGKVLQFTLEITAGKPAYTALDVTPQSISPSRSGYPSRYPTTDAFRPTRPNGSRSISRVTLPKLQTIPSITQTVTPALPTSTPSKDWKPLHPLIPVTPAVSSRPISKPQAKAQTTSVPVVSSNVMTSVTPVSPIVPLTFLEPVQFTTQPDASSSVEPAVLANTISMGLPLALQQNEISPKSKTYSKVQAAIRLLTSQKVKTLSEAAKKTGVELAVLKRLETLASQTATAPAPTQPVVAVPSAETPTASVSTVSEQRTKDAHKIAATARVAAPNHNPATLANSLARGLPVAIHQKEVKLNSQTYDKIQSAIRLLRKSKAKTLPDAAQQSGLKIALLRRVEAFGHPDHLSDVEVQYAPPPTSAQMHRSEVQ